MAEDYQASQRAIALSTDRIRQDAPVQADQAPVKKKEDCWMLPDWLCRKLEAGSNVEQQAEPKAEAGLLDRVKGAVLVDVPGRIGKLVEIAESMTEHVVKLMVVFLLQTLVVPLALGWALLRGVGMLLRARPAAHCSSRATRQPWLGAATFEADLPRATRPLPQWSAPA